MYEDTQKILNYLPIRKNKAENDYIEHLWTAFSELDMGESLARPFCIMPFHLLFMLALQYKVLRVSKIYTESCNLFFCGVAGRCKKDLLSDQKSVFDIAFVNERTIPEVFQLVGLDNGGVKSIKALIDDRNNRLAHAKGGIEQDLNGKIVLYIKVLHKIESRFFLMNQQITENLLKYLTSEDDITQLFESLLREHYLDRNDLSEIAKALLKSKKISKEQWLIFSEYLFQQFDFDNEIISKEYLNRFDVKKETYSDDSLFFEELPIVSTNQMLDIVKALYTTIDPYYLASACIGERKRKFDILWRNFKPYADSHFLSQAKTSFHQRSWEMYMAKVLLEKRFEISSQNEGPDFIVNKNVYLECIAPTKGDSSKSDSVPHEYVAKKPSGIMARDVPTKKMIFRITQSIKDKALDQYKKWKSKKWFDEKIPFVVAVNTGDLGYVEDSNMPNVLKALFGFQDMRINMKTGAITFSHRNEILKSNNEPVRVNYFINEEFSFVSGVLFSDKTVINHPEKIGEDCIFVNNPFADNPVDGSFIKLFKSWTASKENNKISLKKNY